MSSSPSQEAVKKSSGWWPYAAPLAVALVLFFLVGTIFETRIETILRNFVERQRQRLFSSTNEESTVQTTTVTPSPQAPIRTPIVPVQTKYSPSQTIVSFNPREALNLEQPQILITKQKLFITGTFRNNDDDISANSKSPIYQEENEIENVGVKERDLKKSVAMRALELESDLDTKSFRSLSEELMRQKSDEKDDEKLSFFSLSNANVNVPHYACKKPDFFNDAGKKSDLSDEVSKDTRYRKRSEMTLMATNLYS